MKKIKILRIIARLNIGGPAIHAVLLTSGLDQNNFTSLLVCGNVGKDEGDMAYYAREKMVVPYFIPELGRELSFCDDLLALVKIYKIIKRERPDIIHTHTAKAGALGRFAGMAYNLLHPFNKKIILVHTFHGHVFSGYFNAVKTKIFILSERFFALFSRKIITVSESVKNELLSFKICPSAKISIIPLGFELDKFLNIIPRSNKILNIGIVGRLVPIKNHRLFLESAKQIIQSNQWQLRFKIIGDGELRSELEGYADKLNLQGYVDFLGWQKNLVKVYADLDIVALTSINEGTPVSLIEAMAAARAVIATDVGGVRDLFGAEVNYGSKEAKFKILERGILVESGNINDFTAALIYLVNNVELRQRLGSTAREFVKIKFTKDRLVKDTEKLYSSICVI